MSIEKLNRWRRTPPKRNGLWLTRERDKGGLGYLLLVENGCVASDDDLARALGQTFREDFNYFDGEDVVKVTNEWNNEWYFVGKRWQEIYGIIRQK